MLDWMADHYITSTILIGVAMLAVIVAGGWLTGWEL